MTDDATARVLDRSFDPAHTSHAGGVDGHMSENDFAGFCPVYHEAVELLGKRWAGVIVRAMLGGATRFSDIVRTVPDLSDRLLSERLKEFEAAGIVERTVIPETPVRIEYHLTEMGRDLAPVIEAVSAWAGRWLVPAGDVE
jgi:DNA-binding HxlR family transcriptional regulator